MAENNAPGTTDAGLTVDEFTAAVGNSDWHVTGGVATATFETGSFAAGVELVDDIGRLADAANHHPDVDLRYPHVTVSVVTHDAGAILTDKDVSLAQRISAAARTRGIDAASTSS